MERSSLDYAPPPVKRRWHPLFWTRCGLLISVAVAGLWMATFERGSADPLWILFLLPRLLVEHVPKQVMDPVYVWYGSALLQWLACGALIDLARRMAHRSATATFSAPTPINSPTKSGH